VENQEPVSNASPPGELPRGRYPARLDDKARLKLPADFIKFFKSLPETKLYLTSLDRQIAHLYPIAEWRVNEKLLDTYQEDPDAADNIAFIAADLGADVEMDAQGTIIVHPDLRRELEMEGQELHLIAYKGHVEILTDARYKERKERATPENTAGNLKTMKKAELR
jgi:DNA-binding transcriptional regulator/RsmH inhibitor MraZ